MSEGNSDPTLSCRRPFPQVSGFFGTSAALTRAATVWLLTAPLLTAGAVSAPAHEKPPHVVDSKHRTTSAAVIPVAARDLHLGCRGLDH